MTVHDVYEALRIANAGAGLAVTALLLTRLRAWKRAPWHAKVARLVIFGWVTSLTYGTFEALHMAVTTGPRIPALTSMFVLTAYYVRCEARYERRTEDAAKGLRAHLRDSPRA
jgi:hypothetical protein